MEGVTWYIVNLYVEPQFSVFHSGNGTPTWQLFAGVTFKIPIGERSKVPQKPVRL
jgi:hypothetical protein